MEWLRGHYDCVTLSTFVARMARGESLRRTAAVTFDDAYQGVVAHALPLLRTLHIPSTVFVVSRAADDASDFWWDDPRLPPASPEQRARWLHECAGDGAVILADLRGGRPARPERDLRAAEWGDLREAARHGAELGAHGRTHRALTALDASSLESEVAGCAEDLYGHTGVRPACFAYPYGLWDARTRNVVQEAGFCAAVTTQMGLVDTHDDRLALARISIPAGLPLATFENWLAGVRVRGRTG
jgi:peptidoglycan/xylan/chitin deacetylase (PgdA/CDA1 family)